MYKGILGTSYLKLFVALTAALLISGCGSTTSEPGEIVRDYYSAIEANDASAAASVFAEEVTIVIPSGNVLTGIDEVKSTFIPYDLQFMDRVEFRTEFTQSERTTSWTQEWHHVEGDSFLSDCEITVEEGKIIEWVFN